MEEKQYIERLQHIREQINTLVYELWNVAENQEVFFYRSDLYNQVISDITLGYEVGH